MLPFLFQGVLKMMPCDDPTLTTEQGQLNRTNEQVRHDDTSGMRQRIVSEESVIPY